MIKINFVRITPEYAAHHAAFLNAVPTAIKTKLQSYHLIEDRLRGVIGKLLLKKLLMEEGYTANVLEQVKQDAHDRPFIDNTIDFNIAHSGSYIICAVSRETKLGIDIEKIRNLDIDDFNIGLSNEELDGIKKHHSPVNRFFSVWTQKEAVSKANGKGLEVLLSGIIIKNNSAICENEKWMLKELYIDNEYVSYIAYKEENDVVLQGLELSDLSDIL